MKPTKRQKALALIALITQSEVTLEGRTRFQKLSYLANMMGWNAIDDYRFHYYGPFSDSLTSYVEEMCEIGWLQESPLTTNGGNTFYKYSVGNYEKAKAMVSRIEDPKLIHHTEGLLSSLRNFSSDELEIMSSLVFLYENEKLEGEELIRRTNDLKPRFSEAQIRDCYKIFRILSDFIPKYKQHLPINS